MRSVSDKWSVVVVVAGLVSCMLFPRSAGAQATCFPTGGMGVPGQPGLPDWWAGTAPFDDPRWLGSYGYGQNTGKLTAMVETSGTEKFVVLKWHVKPDPGIAGVGDRLFVGLFNPTTTVGTILKLTRDANVTTSAGVAGAGVMTVTALTRTGTSGLWASATVPADVLSKARVDIFCDGGFPAICNEWAVRLRIPTTAAAGGIELGDVFKMWFELDVEHGGTTDRTKFPAGALTADDTAFPSAFPEPLGSAAPASAPWNDVRIAGAGTCTAGVELVSNNDINVSNATGTGTEIDLTSANTFHARPHNNTAFTYNPDSIKARFRIADWGSAVGDSPRWITVPDPSCEGGTGTGAPGSIAPGTGVFDLTCSWTMTAGQRCAYRPDLAPGCVPDPGPRYRHQCIMAELFSNGAPVPFARESYWNNFHFGPASKLERSARIDIGTLSPRDVYLYVMAQNMPSKVTEAPTDNAANATGGLSPAVRKQIGRIVPGRVGEKEAMALRAMVAAGQLTYDELATVMPTYAVYVWHDTGTTEKSPTGTSKVLQTQPSFTLFVSHDGPLVGWNHGLTGMGGATVTEVSKNFYRVAVGASGTVEVLTTVEAIEQDVVKVEPAGDPTPAPPPVGTPWWMWLLIAVLVAGLLAILLRRRP